MNLTTPLSEAGRSHKMYAKRLEKLNIITLQDFLYHLPSRYDDLSHVTSIAEAKNGEVVTIQGQIVQVKNVYTKRSKKLTQGKVSDATGEIDLLWFNQPFLTQSLHNGDTVSLSGRVEIEGNKKLLVSPMHEVIREGEQPLHTGRLVPIYPETHGVSSKWLRRQVYSLLKEFGSELEDFLPEKVKQELHYQNLHETLWHTHFPENLEQASLAKERLAFDEVFLVQLGAMKRRKQWRQDQSGFLLKNFPEQVEELYKTLPFSLTNAQKRAVEEMITDFTSGKPMNRLLEGDVGSGKTIVAAIGMYLAYLNGYQSVLMAPTEILAQQHFEGIKKILEPLGIKIALRTGSKKIADKEFDMLIGTHAVLSEKIDFDKLGFVVIDEQQRFGVSQRSLLRTRGKNPHVLTMTATPIPRTVALALYGDLDLSILDEMPKGRKEIKTWLIPDQKREGSYKWIRQRVQAGEQVFIICPFIEESENMTTVKAATKEFERLQKDIFPDLQIAMLHGKMKPKEKDAMLQAFREKKFDILVATPVVEVGIDIPNATVIVIEGAERFGLAGLHQLRGRVGRGDKQSYCLLFTESKNMQTTTRLKALETLHNGAALAELDLQMRGAGELYGTLQHGRRWFKIASFGDTTLMEKAKQAAQKIFREIEKYPVLQKKMEEKSLAFVSPD